MMLAGEIVEIDAPGLDGKTLRFAIVPKDQAAAWVQSLSPSPAITILLSGDRWACVEKVALATEDDQTIGIATIAPHGETGCGDPAIVAIYVDPARRRCGVGRQLLEVAVSYLLGSGLSPIHIDVLNTKVARMIDHMPALMRKSVAAVDQSSGGALDALLES